MTTVRFTRNLAHLVDCPAASVQGGTVREVLEAYFARYPRVRGYVLDDEGAARQHVAVFVGESTIIDRRTLSDAVGPDQEVVVMQALSGGAW